MKTHQPKRWENFQRVRKLLEEAPSSVEFKTRASSIFEDLEEVFVRYGNGVREAVIVLGSEEIPIYCARLTAFHFVILDGLPS